MKKLTIIFLTCVFVLAQTSCTTSGSNNPLKHSGASDVHEAAGTQVVSNRGDPVAGEQVYNRCIGCHSLGQNRTGPKHCGLIGRKAGSIKAFEYSAAMKNSGIIWNESALERFLTAPFDVVPGTTMGFAGIKQEKDRQDLIAYLKAAMVSADCK